MARVKFGSIVTEGHGSLGGHTFQNSHGGAQMRSKPINKKKPSLAQSLIRSYNPQMQAGWRALTALQRKIWDEYAVSHDRFNKNGDKHHLSGHSLWMQLQFVYISNGFALQPDVYKAVLSPYGSELIINGDFYSAYGWLINGSWSISGGSANYLVASLNWFGQSLSLSLGQSCRISFDITNCVGTAQLAFANQVGSLLFSAPYADYFFLSSGSYVYDVSLAVALTFLRLYSNPASASFSIDNLSMRIITG